MSASILLLRSESRTASALSRAPCISCQSLRGIAGMFVVTVRATTFSSAQAASMAAMRATLARTAMIFAARSDPRAIVLTDTNARLFQYLGFNRFSSQHAYAKRERGYIIEARFVKISLRR